MNYIGLLGLILYTALLSCQVVGLVSISVGRRCYDDIIMNIWYGQISA